MLMIKVHVQRGPLETIPKTIPVHEAELLRQLYGEAAVAPVGEPFQDGRVIDDVALEYERLGKAYGRDRDVNMPVVQAVYGRLAEGRFSRILAECGAIESDAAAGLPPMVAAAMASQKEAGAAPAPAAPAAVELPDIDPDGNGYIKVEELRGVLKAIGVEPPAGIKRDELMTFTADAVRAQLAARGEEVGPDLSLVELVDALREADELAPVG